MFELIGWDIGMNLGEAILLVVGAVVIAAIAQYIGRVSFGYEWVFTGIAALVGGWLGSEAFGSLSTWGPVFEGLYLLPALIGAVVLGGVIDALVRFSSGGTYLAPRPI
jgi:uncharacterized membrane protein YeaQ/YmgE (transglycosylase-associated protein family)